MLKKKFAKKVVRIKRVKKMMGPPPFELFFLATLNELEQTRLALEEAMVLLEGDILRRERRPRWKHGCRCCPRDPR